jgi:tetratricopeptide (TPR) repeat protein
MKNPSVQVRRETVTLPTYEPLPADRNPMFIEKRVYQGSSGRIYPLPFHDRVADEKTDRVWDAVQLENAFIEVMILPEIGGRIHVGRDKTNGYDFFYRQDVIKPALVGLAGPWISGGVEFNWPQHHRPATFLPTAVEIEHHPDGAVTVWCGDHDPLARMKGMHGVCLHPDRADIELKVRVYNRTQSAQTFLWWANVATRAHEAYQSFFPPDVTHVADHARRSMSAYPLCDGHYYGVDYAGRARRGVPESERPAHFLPPPCGGKSPIDYAANDLSFYANIPVPTSYMGIGSREDFFGGYDHREQAGVVHVATHHIAPGKKQWTWGNHEFGYAWDRNLTDPDATGECAPYIELMAGVYTDNQPDFAFLMPGETKTWSQYWYPIQQIGPARHANLAAAVSLKIAAGKIHAGVSVSRLFPKATIALSARGKSLHSATADLAPGAPWTKALSLPKSLAESDLRLQISAADGSEIIAFQPRKVVPADTPPAATEPPAPDGISSIEELYLTGLHLDQYRHATRDPLPYWQEALRRDAGDSRCNNAVGLWRLRRGEFAAAERHFSRAIERLTLRNGNPADGEPLYNLGLARRHLGRDEEAYAAFYKSAWNFAWQAAAYHALAELDCRAGRWPLALEHLDRSLRLNADHLNARNLRVMVLRKLGRTGQAAAALAETRALDPLDGWACWLAGRPVPGDTQATLDLALDLARAGLDRAALDLLKATVPTAGTAPLVGYYLGWLCGRRGDDREAAAHCRAAAKASPDYCFPARLEEIAILEDAMRRNPSDARAPYYLGNLLYDRRRHREAIALWKRATQLDPDFAIAWRNLGIGLFNIAGQPAKARAAYERACRANPKDARLLYERDQLWKRLGVKPATRLRELEKKPALVAQRDDLSVEFCALCNQLGRHEDALAILSTRKFQPWEGGEGQALGQHVRTHLALGRKALAAKDAATARLHFERALTSPRNLAEAKHLLANQSDIHYWLGVALDRLGDRAGATRHWKRSAEFRGDFQEMSVRAFSELTYFSARSLQRLGKAAAAQKLLRELLAHARELSRATARIDYFATSLPTMLLFDDDIQFRQETAARFLQAQARLGLGQKPRARELVRAVLVRDPNHPLAAQLLDEASVGGRA